MNIFDKLENICHANLALFVFLGQVQMHLCIKYEGSMINYS